MTLRLHIPDSVVDAIRIPEGEMAHELLVELAIALCAKGALAFRKARELAAMGKYELGCLLGLRGISRHYGQEELTDDLIYANCE